MILHSILDQDPIYHIEILEPKQVYLLGEQDNHTELRTSRSLTSACV